MISTIEVDLMEVFANSHNENTCAHCLAAAQYQAAKGGEVAVALATSSTSGATADKSATSFGASSDSQVESIRKGVKWNVSGSDQLTYSFYESDGSSPQQQTHLPVQHSSFPDQADRTRQDCVQHGYLHHGNKEQFENIYQSQRP